MSGTSADGVDGALLWTDGITVKAFGPTKYIPYPASLKRSLIQAYGKRPGPEGESLAQEILHYHLNCVTALLKETTQKVDLIGFHGQTIFHKPPETYQIGDGKALATEIGIPVVDQFRLNDLAHGGQGAPFIPVFHQALAQDIPKPLAILNIGGVANVTWIGEKEDDLLGFDVGPGNGLIDDFVQTHTEFPWDEGGAIAQRGIIHEKFLEKWLQHPFFDQPPPKSLDRQTFHTCLADIKDISFEDGVATLTAFTAAAVQKSLEHLPQKSSLWLVAGGGAHNDTLLSLLRKYMKTEVKKTSEIGWNGDALEAQAFAFLAVRSFKGLPLSFPGTTGVRSACTGGRLSFPGRGKKY